MLEGKSLEIKTSLPSILEVYVQVHDVQTDLKWSCKATLKSKASPLSSNPRPTNAFCPAEQTECNTINVEMCHKVSVRGYTHD